MQITFKPNNDKPQKKVKECPDRVLESPVKEMFNAEEPIVEETVKQKVGFAVDEVMPVEQEEVVEYVQDIAQEQESAVEKAESNLQYYPDYPQYPDHSECPECPGHKPGWEYPDYPDCKPDYPDYPDYPEYPEEEPDYDFPEYPEPDCPEEEPDYDYPEDPGCPAPEPPGYPCDGHRCDPYPYPGKYYPLQCLGYAYIPWQIYGRTYSQSEALRRGTLFPELYSPYYLDRTPPIIPDPYRDFNQRPPMMRKKRR